MKYLMNYTIFCRDNNHKILTYYLHLPKKKKELMHERMVKQQIMTYTSTDSNFTGTCSIMRLNERIYYDPYAITVI